MDRLGEQTDRQKDRLTDRQKDRLTDRQKSDYITKLKQDKNQKLKSGHVNHLCSLYRFYSCKVELQVVVYHIHSNSKGCLTKSFRGIYLVVNN